MLMSSFDMSVSIETNTSNQSMVVGQGGCNDFRAYDGNEKNESEWKKGKGGRD